MPITVTVWGENIHERRRVEEEYLLRPLVHDPGTVSVLGDAYLAAIEECECLLDRPEVELPALPGSSMRTQPSSRRILAHPASEEPPQRLVRMDER